MPPNHGAACQPLHMVPNTYRGSLWCTICALEHLHLLTLPHATLIYHNKKRAQTTQKHFYLQKKVHTRETCTYESCKHVLVLPTYLGVEVEMVLRAKSTLDTPFSSRTSAVEAHFHLGIVFGLREDASITRKYRPVPVLRSYILPCNPLIPVH